MSHLISLFIPMLPYVLLTAMVLNAILKKDKWIMSAILGFSFSSGPLFFLLIKDDIDLLGSFNIGYRIGMYASITATLPLAFFGWHLGRRLSLKWSTLLSFIAVLTSLLVVKIYQVMIRTNIQNHKKEIVFDCSHLPYHCAIKGKRLDEIQILKQKGFDINARDPLSRSPLWYGVDNLEVVKVLLENGADPDSFNIYGETPLAYSLVISMRPNLDIARELMKHGALINRAVGFRKKITILNFAIVNKSIDVINFALENGADPNAVDDYKKTPCMRLEKFPSQSIKNLKKYCP